MAQTFDEQQGRGAGLPSGARPHALQIFNKEKNMKITIDYKQAHGDFALALAHALQIDVSAVEVCVTPAKNFIPFCAEWQVVNKCGDAVVKINGEYLLLNII